MPLTLKDFFFVVDNVARNGVGFRSDSGDPRVQVVRHLYDPLTAESRVTATAVRTVDGKGYDGLAMTLVTA